MRLLEDLLIEPLREQGIRDVAGSAGLIAGTRDPASHARSMQSMVM